MRLISLIGSRLAAFGRLPGEHKPLRGARFKKTATLLGRYLRARQTSLHSRITNVFLISLIAFITIAGSSLLLVFNYQLHRYTQFVGYQYAVQFARMLEMYHNTQNSWEGIRTWLHRNFTATQNSSQTAQMVQKSGSTAEQMTKSPAAEQVNRAETAGTNLAGKTRLNPHIQLEDRLHIKVGGARRRGGGTETLGSHGTEPNRQSGQKYNFSIGSNMARGGHDLLFETEPGQQRAADGNTVPYPDPSFHNDLNQLSMLLNHISIMESDGIEREFFGNESFFYHNDEDPKDQGHLSPPNFYFYFLSEPGTQNLVLSDQLSGRKYLGSAILSFCLVDPFCALDDNPANPNYLRSLRIFPKTLNSSMGSMLSNNLPINSDKFSGAESSVLGPIFDQWFQTFFQLQDFQGSIKSSSQRMELLSGESLQNFLREKGFAGWVHREDRPDLFAVKQLAPDNLLSRLQLRYMNMSNRNDQTFVLFDPQSKVIASNLPENSLVEELGSTWPLLQKYIAKYAPGERSSQTANGSNDLNTSNGESAASLASRHLLFSFGSHPSLVDNRNIFVINGNNGRPVGFLYAQSIVSPIWKRLNYEVNTVIIKIALLSCLVIALAYWLIDRFHLRKLFMPLRSLSDIAGEVRKGNTEARVEKIPREAELALVTEQFNKMLDSLAHEVMLREQQYRDVAHELRTPITIISGELQLIQEGVYRADKDKIQALINQVQQMQGIVQDLEILYKVSQKDAALQPELAYPEEISALQLANEAFSAFQTQMKQRNIDFSLRLDFNAPLTAENICVEGDARRLHQVFANCLVNAMRYTPGGGRIELAACHLPSRQMTAELSGEMAESVRPVEDKSDCNWDNSNTDEQSCCAYWARNLPPGKDYLLFSIADTGCGIAAEKRGLVFERFFRVAGDRSHHSGGCGLGLAISKSFVELHGGRIWAEESHLRANTASEDSGPGARFIFALPCSQKNAE